MYLTRLTGKSREAIHPKHLIEADDFWYLKYLDKNDFVLDIGCANGQHTLKVAKKVKKIIGFDINRKELSKAEREMQRRKIKNVEFFEDSAEKNLKFKSRTFDKVLLLDVLEHINNQNLLISEIWRVLKNSGGLILAVPNKNTSWKRLQRSVGLDYFADPDHKREYSESEIKEILLERKFKILKIDPVVLDTPLAPIFAFIGGFSLAIYSKLQNWKRKKALENPSESTGFEIVAQKV